MVLLTPPQMLRVAPMASTATGRRTLTAAASTTTARRAHVLHRPAAAARAVTSKPCAATIAAAAPARAVHVTARRAAEQKPHYVPPPPSPRASRAQRAWHWFRYSTSGRIVTMCGSVLLLSGVVYPWMDNAYTEYTAANKQTRNAARLVPLANAAAATAAGKAGSIPRVAVLWPTEYTPLHQGGAYTRSYQLVQVMATDLSLVPPGGAAPTGVAVEPRFAVALYQHIDTRPDTMGKRRQQKDAPPPPKPSRGAAPVRGTQWLLRLAPTSAGAPAAQADDARVLRERLSAVTSEDVLRVALGRDDSLPVGSSGAGQLDDALSYVALRGGEMSVVWTSDGVLTVRQAENTVAQIQSDPLARAVFDALWWRPRPADPPAPAAPAAAPPPAAAVAAAPKPTA